MHKKFTDFSGKKALNVEELLKLKAGFTCYNYGCESNVCLTNRAGAKDLCTTAYCRSGVGPISSGDGGLGNA